LPQVLATMQERKYAGLASLSPSIPEALCRAVHRALEPDPEARFRNVGAFARALIASVRSDQAARWLLEFEESEIH